MRLVGAKNGYIRWPFFLEGGWIGLIGSIVPILILTYGYSQVYGLAAPYLLQSNLELLRPNQIVWILDITMAVGGYLIGSLGSIGIQRSTAFDRRTARLRTYHIL